MTKGHLVAEGVLATGPLLKRYLPGFDGTNHTRQAPGLPNHLAWCLGHLALTMHRVGEKIDGVPPPAGDFVVGSDRGDAVRFGTESVSFKSVPTDEPARYPSFERCVAIFDGACERLAASLRGASDSHLETAITWGPTTITLLAAGQRMIYHNGMHTGQIADLRRTLGMRRVLE